MKDKTMWDFASPDIVYGDATVDWSIEDGRDVLFVIRFPSGRLLPMRAHVRWENLSHVMSQRYYVWKCTNEYRGGLCNYAPSHEDMPPLPGQRCHQCGQERAIEIPGAVEVRKGNTMKDKDAGPHTCVGQEPPFPSPCKACEVERAENREASRTVVERLNDAERHERHLTYRETMYWFNQYKRIAQDAVALVSDRRRHLK